MWKNISKERRPESTEDGGDETHLEEGGLGGGKLVRVSLKLPEATIEDSTGAGGILRVARRPDDARLLLEGVVASEGRLGEGERDAGVGLNVNHRLVHSGGVEVDGPGGALSAAATVDEGVRVAEGGSKG